jgi:hypothetical protein
VTMTSLLLHTTIRPRSARPRPAPLEDETRYDARSL